MKHYKFVFRDRKTINATCPYCGHSCSGLDEYAESVRKTTSYFHKICVEQYLRRRSSNGK